MANEFVARKGLIVLENGARISGSVSSSVGVTAPYFYGSGQYLTDIVAGGTISSSAQFNDPNAPFTGSFSGSFSGSANISNLVATTITGSAISGSFFGNGSGLTGIATTLNISGTLGSDAVNLQTDALSFLGVAGGITASVTNNTVTFALPPGTVSSSEQVPLPDGSVSSSAQIDHNQTANYTASRHVDHNEIGIFAGSGLSGGGYITSSITLSLNTGSATFITGTVGVLNTKGVISSSAQVNANQITGIGAYATTGSNTFVGNQIISGSLITTADTMNFNGAMSVSGSLTITGSVLSTGGFTGSLLGTSSWATNALTASYALASALPPGTVSSSEQIRSGSFTGSFLGNLIGTSSWANNVQYSGITNLPTLVSQSSQIIATQITGIGAYATTGSNTFTGIQNITNTTNSTDYTNGALIVAGGVGIGKDVNISGSLTVTGLLTVVSMSTQYVTSSQFTVGTNRIILNDDDLVRFAGISVIDSGSTYGTGSLLWDSLYNRWIYQADDQAYNSAVLIAGPKNTGSLGNESGLTSGRIPVATGDDHIDTNSTLTPLRVVTGNILHIENGVYVTGSVTSSTATISNTLYSGNTTTNIIGPNTPSGQVVATVPVASYDGAHFDYLIKDGTNFRTGTVMAVWDGSSIVYTDTSTTDIGSTIQASFEVDLSGGNARLKFLISSGTWTTKISIRAF